MTSPQPPRLPIVQGMSLTLKLDHKGQPAVIVLGGRGAGSWTDTDGATVWRDAAWTALRALVSTSTVLTGAVVRQTLPDGQIIEIGPPATLTAGAKDGAIALGSACSLIKWSTAQGGRSGKGRTYLPGLTHDSVNADGRTYTPTHTAAMTTAANAYLSNSALAAEGITPAVLSFRKGAAYPILTAAPGTVVGLQRRRMR